MSRTKIHTANSLFRNILRYFAYKSLFLEDFGGGLSVNPKDQGEGYTLRNIFSSKD
jgi:hypothetical protein